MGIFGSKFQPFLKKTKAETTPYSFRITDYIYILFFVFLVNKQKGNLSRNFCDESEYEEREEDEGMARKVTREECGDEIVGITEKFQCLALHKRETAKRGKSPKFQ